MIPFYQAQAPRIQHWFLHKEFLIRCKNNVFRLTPISPSPKEVEKSEIARIAQRAIAELGSPDADSPRSDDLSNLPSGIKPIPLDSVKEIPLEGVEGTPTEAPQLPLVPPPQPYHSFGMQFGMWAPPPPFGAHIPVPPPPRK